MDPSKLPAAELGALSEGLLAALKTGAGAHKRASFHLDLETTDDKLEIDSVRGGDLSTADPEAESKGEFIGLDHYDNYMALLQSAVAAKCPLYLVHYDFWKASGKWKQRLTVQSLAEYEQMLKERAPIDQTIETALLDAAGTGWKRVVCSRSDMPPIQKLELVAFYGKKLRVLTISGALKSGINELWAFYRERGFKLEDMSFALDAGPRKHKRDYDVYYVPEQPWT